MYNKDVQKERQEGEKEKRKERKEEWMIPRGKKQTEHLHDC